MNKNIKFFNKKIEKFREVEMVFTFSTYTTTKTKKYNNKGKKI